MGVQATLRDIQSGFKTATAHTANNTDIEQALNKALDRTDTVDNSMEVDLDYGNNRGINLADGQQDSDAATVRQIKNAVEDSINSGGATATAINAAVDIAVASAVAAAGTGFVVQRVEYQTGFSSGQTVVTLQNITFVPGVNNVVVVRNGLTQTSGVDYSEDSTTQLTMTLPLVADDRLIIRANDSTTSSVSDSDAIAHTSGSNTTTLSVFLDAVTLSLSELETSAGIDHTNSDGTVKLNTYLDAEKVKSDAAEALAPTYWQNESGAVNPMLMTGAIMAFATDGIKNGWAECNGQALSRTTHAGLFSEIGTSYGSGDGSTTFNVPDIRGEFVRGWDAGRGVDAGRVLGTLQSYQVGAHQHPSGVEVGGADGGNGATVSRLDSDYSSNELTAVNPGGSETRPRNIAFPYYIKL